MSKPHDRDTDPPRRPGAESEAGGSERPGAGPRVTAAEETDRLTNMVAALNAGAAVIPIPGQALALTGGDLLLIGAIVKVWDHPLSDGFLEGFWRFIGSRWAVGVGVRLVGDTVGMIPGLGTLLKPAAHAGATKLMGSSLRTFLERIHGAEHPAAITAEEARDNLQKAMARIAVYTPDLTTGVKEAVGGDTSKLARTLRKIFSSED